VASDIFRVHQIRFRPGLRPDPTGGTYSAPPGPLAALRGPTSKGRGREEMKGRGEGNKKRRGGTGLLSQIPGSAPGNGIYSQNYM